MNGSHSLTVSHWPVRLIGVVGGVVFALFSVLGFAVKSPWTLIFFALALVYVLLALLYGKTSMDRRGITHSAPLGRYALDWDEVKAVVMDLSGNNIVFKGDGKQLVLPGFAFWAGRDKAALRQLMDQELRQRGIEISRGFAPFALSRYCRVKGPFGQGNDSSADQGGVEPHLEHLNPLHDRGEDERGYDIDEVRALLYVGFTAEDLRRLFLFSPNPALRPVAEELSTADGLGVAVDKAMAYCQERALLSDLLAEVRYANPRQYARFELYLRMDVREKEGRFQYAGRYFPGANLRGADLSGADLYHHSLSRADLRGADLRGADLCGAKLDAADLGGADLAGADLSRADLRGANLTGANLDGANLEHANLTGAILDASTQIDAKWRLVCEISSSGAVNRDLRNADLRQANLQHVDLQGSDLRGADLREASLVHVDLREADLRGTDLGGADLSGANWAGAILDSSSQLDDDWRLVWEISNQGAAKRDLRGMRLTRVGLRGADLHRAKLTGADLVRVDLREADLAGADLKGADLNLSDLRGANLNGADLGGANLSTADLRRADLHGANLKNARVTANLTGADLRGANLTAVKLARSILHGANLHNANVSRVDLSAADLSEAFLEGANLSRANLNAALLGEADLTGADLSRACLKGAQVKAEQLAQAKTVEGATMPDGTVHE